MDTRSHVAVTTTQFQHRVPGGSATSVAQLLDHLQRDGAVRLSALLAAGDLRRPAGIVRRERPTGLPPGMRTVRMGVPLPFLYDTWRRWGHPRVDRAVPDADLLHVTIPVKVAAGRLRVVATVHDVFPLTRAEESTARGASLMAEGLRWIRDNAVAVMVPSRSVLLDCIEVGFDEERLTVVHWGSNVEGVGGTALTAAGAAISTQPNEAMKSAVESLGVSGSYVLFVGTVEPRKNLPMLVEAMRRLNRPEVTLVLAGSTGWGPDLTDELAGLASPVHRLGFVSDDQLEALRRCAAAVVFPSLAEGFGLPVLESLAQGVPTLTSAGTACAEIAGDAALRLDPNDPDEWSAALAQVLDDELVAADLAARGPHRAAEFTWEEATRRTLAVYEQALG